MPAGARAETPFVSRYTQTLAWWGLVDGMSLTIVSAGAALGVCASLWLLTTKQSCVPVHFRKVVEDRAWPFRDRKRSHGSNWADEAVSE